MEAAKQYGKLITEINYEEGDRVMIYNQRKKIENWP